jgi:hypothetical protein
MANDYIHIDGLVRITPTIAEINGTSYQVRNINSVSVVQKPSKRKVGLIVADVILLAVGGFLTMAPGAPVWVVPVLLSSDFLKN